MVGQQGVDLLDRRQRREEMAGPVALVVEYDLTKVSFDAHLVEVSSGGATLQTRVKLVPGENVQIIPNDGGRTVATQVVWVNELEVHEVVEAGLRFV
jgi:hypothetical protein